MLPQLKDNIFNLECSYVRLMAVIHNNHPEREAIQPILVNLRDTIASLTGESSQYVQEINQERALHVLHYHLTVDEAIEKVKFFF